MFLYGFLSVWPIHLHFLLLIWVVIFSYSWVFASGSSLLMVFDHRTPRMLRGQRFVKAWIFGEIFFVTLQVSAPYIRTDFTFVLKILSLVLRDISSDLNRGLSRRNAVLALPILASTSRPVSPSSAITLPGKVKEATFSISSLFSLIGRSFELFMHIVLVLPFLMVRPVILSVVASYWTCPGHESKAMSSAKSRS